MLVPADITLHALHYMIQRLFGWQNSHLRQFELTEQDYDRVTEGEKLTAYGDLVGVLFRFPDGNVRDILWDDEYDSGSFKVWLRKRYRGPYVTWPSGADGEKYEFAREQMEDLYERIPMLTVRESFDEYYDRVKREGKGEKDRPRVKKEIPIREATVRELATSIAFEGSFMALLERLPIDQILLLPGEEALPDNTWKRFVETGYRHFTGHPLSHHLGTYIYPAIVPFAHELIYNYDFGDDWRIRITCTGVCEESDEQAEIVREKYQPVCVAADGCYLVDDCGGIYGFCKMLETIYGEDVDPAEKKDMKRWARDMGWSEKVEPLEKML